MSSHPPLARRLSTADAVVIGLGSMLGAGVFAVFAPAAAAAGSWLLVGLALAAVVAYCNAAASAQLAAQYPTSGGTYAYGRERLGPWWGFLAGWGFVVGKTASCAAMALTFAAYVAPTGWQRLIAAAAVVALAGVNLRGITRTARLSRVLVGVVLAVLAMVVVAGIIGITRRPETGVALSAAPVAGGLYGTLQSAGLLFFAFAGYARVATLGEEVRNPQRSIPRAVGVALGVVVALYLLIAVVVLAALGPARLATSTAPLADVVRGAGWGWALPVVATGAAAGALGALLALITGLGRTSLAMAREGDLPRPLVAVSPRYQVPYRAEIAVAVVVVVLVCTVDLRAVIGFSSFGVLVYYLIANLAARTQTGRFRRYPRGLQALGALGCIVLATTLPWPSVAIGAAVFAVGAGYRLAIQQWGSPQESGRRDDT